MTAIHNISVYRSHTVCPVYYRNLSINHEVLLSVALLRDAQFVSLLICGDKITVTIELLRSKPSDFISGYESQDV